MEDPHALSTGWSPTQQPKQPKRAKALRHHATNDAACAGQANQQKNSIRTKTGAASTGEGRGGERGPNWRCTPRTRKQSIFSKKCFVYAAEGYATSKARGGGSLKNPAEQTLQGGGGAKLEEHTSHAKTKHYFKKTLCFRCRGVRNQ